MTHRDECRVAELAALSLAVSSDRLDGKREAVAVVRMHDIMLELYPELDPDA